MNNLYIYNRKTYTCLKKQDHKPQLVRFLTKSTIKKTFTLKWWCILQPFHHGLAGHHWEQKILVRMGGMKEVAVCFVGWSYIIGTIRTIHNHPSHVRAEWYAAFYPLQDLWTLLLPPSPPFLWGHRQGCQIFHIFLRGPSFLWWHRQGCQIYIIFFA